VFHHISRISSGMEEARLRWTGKSSRTRVEQLFERNSPFYQWHRTIQDTVRSVRDVSASTEIKCKDIMLKMSEHNDGEIDYVTTTAAERTTKNASIE
jgi:hypothetical protein